MEIGSVVKVKDLHGKTQIFTIVGRTEADPSEGKISNESPVGKSLIGHQAGENAEVSTPSGTFKYTVLEVE